MASRQLILLHLGEYSPGPDSRGRPAEMGDAMGMLRRKMALPGATLVLLALLAAPLPGFMPQARAQAATSGPADDARQQKIKAEREAAYAALDKVKQVGPLEIRLVDQGMLALPKGLIFIPQPEANNLMRANGNSASPQTIGLIFPDSEREGWWVTLDYISAGYVKDEEAKVWNADELLATMKDATESGNADRIERGFPAIEVSDWVEKPAYDAQNHRLVWSAMVRRKGADAGAGSVNYNTYALGREGYFSLDLITRPDAIAEDKARAVALLSAISYLPGKTYGDFNASTDHIAEYGIAALIGGVALKKLGLLALAAAFILKFAKIGIIAVIAIGAGISRFFRRSKPDA